MHMEGSVSCAVRRPSRMMISLMMLNLGAVYSDMKDWLNAKQEYAAVLKLDPLNVHAETELSIVLLKLGAAHAQSGWL